MEEQRIKPSGWFYVFGLSVFLFGCVAAIALFTIGMVGTVASALNVDRQLSDFERVVVPGSAELVLDETGLYTVFYEYRSVVAGVPYHSSKIRPRLNCELRDKTSGKQVSLNDAWLQDSKYELASRSGTLLMVFEVDRPDTYILSCQYAGNGDAPRVVLAIGTNLLPSVINLAVSVLTALMAPVLMIAGASIVAGLIVIIVAVMRHQSARRIASEAS